MDNGGMLAFGGLAIVIYLAITAAGIALGIWITYEIIWRSVRRGMREYQANPYLPKNKTRAF